MPPLRSNPNVFYLQFPAQELQPCMRALRAGEALLTVVMNTNEQPMCFFAPPAVSEVEVFSAAVGDQLFHAPTVEVALQRFTTYGEFIEAAGVTEESQPMTVEGFVETSDVRTPKELPPAVRLTT